MTWNELYMELSSCCSSSCGADHAANIICHLMDDYESWDWNAVAPSEACSILFHSC